MKKVRVSTQKLETDDPKPPRKIKVLSHYDEGEATVGAIDVIVNYIRDRFHRKITLKNFRQ